MADDAERDSNFTPALLVESNAGDGATVDLWADPTTHRLLVDATGTLAAVDEDDPHVSGAGGALVLAVRNDTLASLVSTDGDNAPLQVSADGALYVEIVAGAGGTEYTEDAATPAAIVGTATMMERDDALTAVTPIEGDWISLRGTAEGALWTQDFNSDAILADTTAILADTAAIEIATEATQAALETVGGLVVNLGTNNDVTVTGTVTANLSATDNAVLDDIAAKLGTIDADTGSILTSVDGIEALLTTIDADTGGILADTASIQTAVELIDDAIFVDDTATHATGTTKGMGIMAAATPTDGSVDANDIGMLAMSLDRRLLTDTQIVGQDANLTVDLGATDNAVLDTIDAVLDTIKTDTAALVVDAAAIEALLTTIDADTGSILTSVDGIEGLLTTIDADTGGILTAVQIMDDWDNAASDGASVSGDVAHDTADAGEPVKVGMKAVALKANPTEVAANDRTNWHADVSGVPFVLGGHPNILTQSLQVTDADGAQTDAAIITAAANVAIVVTKVSVMADNANTVDVSCRIGFGTASTPAADAAQVLLFHPGIAAGSGVVEGSGAGILGIGASGEDVRVTCEDPVTGSINIIVTYFTTDI